MSDRPHRLAIFSYRGMHHYSLTFCCYRRRDVFVNREVVAVALDQILRSAAEWDFVVIAYCFMPDHLHLLVEGSEETADLTAFARDVKQRTGYHWRDKRSGILWQHGYYDRVLRDGEPPLAVARYILENPVRARLVVRPRDYPYSGSHVWTWEQLLEIWDVDAESFKAGGR